MIEQCSRNRCSSLRVRWALARPSVLGEASDILALRNIIHAAIDLDAFGLAHLASADLRSQVNDEVNAIPH
jgi:hypothetical protein